MPGQFIINEMSLPDFRTRAMAPAELYDLIPDDEEALLINLPPGIGKSYAAQGLVRHALNHGHDMVFYVAPTRALIDDFCNALGKIDCPVQVLEPRPQGKCGKLDQRWKSLEQIGCSALAKHSLCDNCVSRPDCSWPDQMSKIGTKAGLIMLTEQYLHLNPSLLVNAVRRARAERPLVIFDEALFMGSVMKQSFSELELMTFQSALRKAKIDDDRAKDGADDLVSFIDTLLDPNSHIRDAGRFFAGSLDNGMVDIQRSGMQINPGQFRYLAYELALLNSRARAGQWMENGKLEIATRVDTTGCDVVVLAPYLDATIVEERLQRPVVRLFPNHIFKHTQAHFINIADQCGSARSLNSKAHFNRICDFFLALTLRNIQQAKRTVLVCRKKFVEQIKDRFETLATVLGIELFCTIISKDNKLITKKPNEIAIINYGIVGINDLQDFDALYCVGSYYCNVGQLNDVYQQCLPPSNRFMLGLNAAGGGRRIVAADGTYTSRYHARLAVPTFKLLERGVVLQAVGRVRPFTSPVEVVLFQSDDLSQELAGLIAHPTLPDARDAHNIPTLKQMVKSKLGERVRNLRQSGRSFRSVSKELEFAPSTLSLAAKAPSLNELLNQITLGENTI